MTNAEIEKLIEDCIFHVRGASSQNGLAASLILENVSYIIRNMALNEAVQTIEVAGYSIVPAGAIDWLRGKDDRAPESRSWYYWWLAEFEKRRGVAEKEIASAIEGLKT